MTHKLTPLNYKFTDLEPSMDALTVEIHYTKHHQSYIDNLNKALENFPLLASKSLTELLQNLSEIPEEIYLTVKNNAGGILNHDLFWEILTPNNSKNPSENLLKIINENFTSFDNMKEKLLESANKHFASGWAFLYLNKDKKLEIKSFPGHESPILNNEYPLLTIDVWEHAYYLKYKNQRPVYSNTIFEMINWEIVESKLKDALLK